MDEIDTLRSESQQIASQLEAFLPPELVELLNRPDRPPFDGTTQRRDLRETKPTASVEAMLPSGYENLIRLVSPAWLKEQTSLCSEFFAQLRKTPFQVVSGRRAVPPNAAKPHRFALMLYAAKNFLENRLIFDSFLGSMLIPEVALLGNQLDEISALGKEGIAKLHGLPTIPSDDVGPTIFELLVGAGCVRQGRQAELLTPESGTRTPDIRIHDLSVPTVVECKRRIALPEYERKEIIRIEEFFEVIQRALIERKEGGVVEAEFSTEVKDITSPSFKEGFEGLLRAPVDSSKSFPWGNLKFTPRSKVRLTYRVPTYSPDFLNRVFGLEQDQVEWDGFIGQVAEPDAFGLATIRNPIGLKWKCDVDPIPPAKARGLTSLYGDAVQQIPPGEMGVVYLSYEEGSRAEVADARTSEIQSASKDWYHKWGISLALVMVDRLYPRPLWDGRPDLVENMIIFAAGSTDPSLVDEFPTKVFVPT